MATARDILRDMIWLFEVLYRPKEDDIWCLCGDTLDDPQWEKYEGPTEVDDLAEFFTENKDQLLMVYYDGGRSISTKRCMELTAKLIRKEEAV